MDRHEKRWRVAQWCNLPRIFFFYAVLESIVVSCWDGVCLAGGWVGDRGHPIGFDPAN